MGCVVPVWLRLLALVGKPDPITVDTNIGHRSRYFQNTGIPRCGCPAVTAAGSDAEIMDASSCERRGENRRNGRESRLQRGNQNSTSNSSSSSGSCRAASTHSIMGGIAMTRSQ